MTDGAVVSLWRYPVKSMMGEELNASDVTDHGLLGDRSLALVDTETGKVVSAKNPKKWPTMFDFRAVFTTPPVLGSPLPPVRVTLPDGVSVTSDDARFAETQPVSASLQPDDVPMEVGVGPVGFGVEQQDLIWAMWRRGDPIREMERALGETLPRIRRYLRQVGWDSADPAAAQGRSSDPGRA
jgi:hypothetical protein